MELSRFMKLVVDEDYEHVLNHDNGICEAEARVDAVMLQQRRYYDPSRGIKVSEKEDIWKLSDSQLEATGYRMAENSALEKDFLAWVGGDTHLNGDKTNLDLNRCSSRILSKRFVNEAQKQVIEIKEEKKKSAELHQKLQTETSSKKTLEKKLARATKQLDNAQKKKEDTEKRMKEDNSMLLHQLSQMKAELAKERQKQIENAASSNPLPLPIDNPPHPLPSHHPSYSTVDNVRYARVPPIDTY